MFLISLTYIFKYNTKINKMKSNSDNFYMVGHLEVPQRKILERPLWFFDGNNRGEDTCRAKFQQLKTIGGYRFDNRHLKFSNIYGHLFAISVHYEHNGRNKTEYFTISVWDSRGSESICNLKQPVIEKELDVLSNDNYKKLCKFTENHSKGVIQCSSCHKEIKASDIAGRYFAGVYCKDCWETKYKAIEAREHYD